MEWIAMFVSPRRARANDDLVSQGLKDAAKLQTQEAFLDQVAPRATLRSALAPDYGPTGQSSCDDVDDCRRMRH